MIVLNKSTLKNVKNPKEAIERVQDIDRALIYLKKMIDKSKHDPEKRKKLEMDYCFLQLRKCLIDIQN